MRDQGNTGSSVAFAMENAMDVLDRVRNADVSVSVTVREGEVYLRLYNHPWSTVARLTPEHAIEVGEMLVEIGKERMTVGCNCGRVVGRCDTRPAIGGGTQGPEARD